MSPEASAPHHAGRQSGTEGAAGARSLAAPSGTCYLVCAGVHYASPPLPGPDDLTIAVDGGWAYLQTLGRSADLLVGDLDSLTEFEQGAEDLPADLPLVQLPVEKDQTDTKAALRQGQARGYRRFCIYGGSGGRLDHTIANLGCLASLAEAGDRGWLVADDQIVTAIHNDSLSLPAATEGIVSVFAYGGPAQGVSIKGLKYELDGATLNCGYSLAVSNQLIGQPAIIEVASGTLLVVYPAALGLI
ncbi:MAG: thiamine diphosphokinase [Coriobacteriales bacterium]|jgi:thiamine pyrophosphokinase|nr:thiamine diphosphokinase [Coriobacteriales bacterium]